MVMQVTVTDTSNVAVAYTSGTSANQKPPLLAIELAAEGTKIVCRTELDSIVPRFLAIFDKAITITQVWPRWLWEHGYMSHQHCDGRNYTESAMQQFLDSLSVGQNRVGAS